MTPKRRALEAALEAAKTTQASAGVTIALIQGELASLEQAADHGLMVYTLTEAAERRNLSAHTLRSWIRSGRLQCRRGPRGAFLVGDADIDRALGTPKAEPVVQHAELCAVEDDTTIADLVRAGKLRRVR